MTGNLTQAREAWGRLLADYLGSVSDFNEDDIKAVSALIYHTRDHDLQAQVETLTRERDEAVAGQHAAECKRIYEQHAEINDLRADRDRCKAALEVARAAILKAAEDTLWCGDSPCETVIDRIDATLDPDQTGDLFADKSLAGDHDR